MDDQYKGPPAEPPEVMPSLDEWDKRTPAEAWAWSAEESCKKIVDRFRVVDTAHPRDEETPAPLLVPPENPPDQAGQRYERSPPAQPSLANLRTYLEDARPTCRQKRDNPAKAEARRVEAIKALRTIARAVERATRSARAWAEAVVEEAGEETLAAPTFADAETQALLREMFEYLSRAGMRIVLAEDPYAELRLFLQGPPRKRKDGRPLEDNELRNFMIALDVIRRANGGMKLEDAYEKIGKAEGLKPKTVEAHYRAGLKSQLMKPPFPGEGEWEIWPPGN